jgi:hypothetical protein
MQTLKNAFRGIFQLASARYTPAPGSVNQALRARFTPGHPAPDGKRRINRRFPIDHETTVVIDGTY